MARERVFASLVASVLLAGFTPVPVSGENVIVGAPILTGTLIAEVSGVPLGHWKYTLEVSWTTGAPQAVSHLDLLLGLSGCRCVCDGFSFGASDTAGTSDGEGTGKTACTVQWEAEFNCSGDPSIPGDEGPLVKFEPLGGGCEPGTAGSGLFVFYSDWNPVGVQEPGTHLLIKYEQMHLFGALSGVLPSCTCETSTETTSWGGVKSRFR
ncbi:MAG: hypothetical protein ABIH26_10650 [Candidatus Eisenbacteria bacterium]